MILPLLGYKGRNYTQGILAFKFPISILTWTQGQHRYQKIRKNADIYVLALDFAEFEKTSNITKILIFFSFLTHSI